jgi:hypothetical protein
MFVNLYFKNSIYSFFDESFILRCSGSLSQNEISLSSYIIHSLEFSSIADYTTSPFEQISYCNYRVFTREKIGLGPVDLKTFHSLDH